MTRPLKKTTRETVAVNPISRPVAVGNTALAHAPRPSEPVDDLETTSEMPAASNQEMDPFALLEDDSTVQTAIRPARTEALSDDVPEVGEDPIPAPEAPTTVRDLEEGGGDSVAALEVSGLTAKRSRAARSRTGWPSCPTSLRPSTSSRLSTPT